MSNIVRNSWCNSYTPSGYQSIRLPHNCCCSNLMYPFEKLIWPSFNEIKSKNHFGNSKFTEHLRDQCSFLNFCSTQIHWINLQFFTKSYGLTYTRRRENGGHKDYQTAKYNGTIGHSRSFRNFRQNLSERIHVIYFFLNTFLSSSVKGYLMRESKVQHIHLYYFTIAKFSG